MENSLNIFLREKLNTLEKNYLWEPEIVEDADHLNLFRIETYWDIFMNSEIDTEIYFKDFEKIEIGLT